jgi:hypothetical protein
MIFFLILILLLLFVLLSRIAVVPTKDPIKDKRYLAYITDDKIGLHILPLCGNPHDAMALIGHPAGVGTNTVQ